MTCCARWAHGADPRSCCRATMTRQAGGRGVWGVGWGGGVGGGWGGTHPLRAGGLCPALSLGSARGRGAQVPRPPADPIAPHSSVCAPCTPMQVTLGGLVHSLTPLAAANPCIHVFDGEQRFLPFFHLRLACLPFFLSFLPACLPACSCCRPALPPTLTPPITPTTSHPHPYNNDNRPSHVHARPVAALPQGRRRAASSHGSSLRPSRRRRSLPRAPRRRCCCCCRRCRCRPRGAGGGGSRGRRQRGAGRRVCACGRGARVCACVWRGRGAAECGGGVPTAH